jgi:hypothetical protein
VTLTGFTKHVDRRKAKTAVTYLVKQIVGKMENRLKREFLVRKPWLCSNAPGLKVMRVWQHQLGMA